MIEDIEMYIYWTTFANMHYDQRRLPVLDTVIWQIEINQSPQSPSTDIAQLYQKLKLVLPILQVYC